MFTITVSASELDAIRAALPGIAKKAKPVKAPARRSARVKTSPIPPAVQREADQWEARAKTLRDGSERSRQIMEKDAWVLRDVIALHRGLPEPERAYVH